MTQHDAHVDAYDNHVCVQAIRAAKRNKDNKRRSYLKSVMNSSTVTMRQMRRGIIADRLDWWALWSA